MLLLYAISHCYTIGSILHQKCDLSMDIVIVNQMFIKDKSRGAFICSDRLGFYNSVVQ